MPPEATRTPPEMPSKPAALFRLSHGSFPSGAGRKTGILYAT
jgi:hypothetical protein